MKKILEFQTREQKFEDFSLEVQRTPEFYSIAQNLSGMIKSLPLDKKQNDDLVFKIIEQLKEAERGAIIQGLTMGLALRAPSSHG